MNEDSEKKEPWYKKFRKFPLRSVTVIVLFLVIVSLLRVPDFGMIQNQIPYPIPFDMLQVGDRYTCYSCTVHVLLKIELRDGRFFTVGLSVPAHCDKKGVYLTAPDEVATFSTRDVCWGFGKFLPGFQNGTIRTNLSGRLVQAQVDYLQDKFMKEAYVCDDSKKTNSNMFHIHRLRDTVTGDYAVYNKLRPIHPDAETRKLEHSINCGTWLTYFFGLDDRMPDATLFSNVYFQHVKMVLPLTRKTRIVYVTSLTPEGDPSNHLKWFLLPVDLDPTRTFSIPLVDEMKEISDIRAQFMMHISRVPYVSMDDLKTGKIVFKAEKPKAI